jgi:catechol 2,3-dioxygenase-like lactoylglutathione lyase family enzyme
MSTSVNPEFTFRGINHLAMVARDMAETIDFYEGVLGMRLVLTLNLPDGGQHFFFDAGNETLMAFFWFPNGFEPDRPGEAAPAHLPAQGDIVSAIGSCNHVAFTVPEEKFEEYVAKLKDKGIACSEIMNHDDSKWQVSRRYHDGVWLRSVYFWDPNGIMLEFAALTKELTPADVRHDPRNAAGEFVPLADTVAGRRLGRRSDVAVGSA